MTCSGTVAAFALVALCFSQVAPPAAAQGFFKKKEVAAPAPAASTPVAPASAVARPAPSIAVSPPAAAISPSRPVSTPVTPTPMVTAPAASKVVPGQPAQAVPKTTVNTDQPRFPPTPQAAPMPLPFPQQAKVPKATSPSKASSSSAANGTGNKAVRSAVPLGQRPLATTQSGPGGTLPSQTPLPAARTPLGSCSGMDAISKGVCLSLQCLKPQFSSTAECIKMESERKARESVNEGLRG